MEAYRAAIFHVLDDPSIKPGPDAFDYWDDGGLLVEDGLIKDVGAWSEIKRQLSDDVPVNHFKDGMIVPGFVDTHIHYPQVDVIASFGVQLLDWLNNYTFPAEQKFSDQRHAESTAEFFLDELLKNGTTCALVFATVHKSATELLFKAAQKRRLRIVAGKVLMDRHAPDGLRDTPESGYNDSAALISKWHNTDRLSYAITPRFAVTSSSDQLAKAGQLLAENPGVYMQTHMSENKKEIALVEELFPDARNYLSVYEGAGLLGDHSVFAHGIHLDKQEFDGLGRAGAGISFCPTSNLFLGSGLFDLQTAEQHKINVGLGTDIGGGTSFSMFQTMNEAYKVCQMRGAPLDPIKSFYLSTLGGARTLNFEDKIGNLMPGKEADFLVLDLKATPLLSRRLSVAKSISEKMFVLSMLGDDRTIDQTYVLGKQAYKKTTTERGLKNPASTALI